MGKISKGGTLCFGKRLGGLKDSQSMGFTSQQERGDSIKSSLGTRILRQPISGTLMNY